MNLYSVLGTRRNASAASLKKAFRARAKATHPDQGGSTDEFRAVHIAWKVLSDPEKRRRYDATGRIDEVEPDNDRAKVLGAVVRAFDAATQEAAKRNQDLLQSDMVSMMRRSLQATLGEMRRSEAEIRASRALLIKLLGRFEHVDGGASLFDGLLSDRIANMDRGLRSLETDATAVASALELVSSYRFRREELVTMLMMTSTSTTATIS